MCTIPECENIEVTKTHLLYLHPIIRGIARISETFRRTHGRELVTFRMLMVKLSLIHSKPDGSPVFFRPNVVRQYTSYWNSYRKGIGTHIVHVGQVPHAEHNAIRSKDAIDDVVVGDLV